MTLDLAIDHLKSAAAVCFYLWVGLTIGKFMHNIIVILKSIDTSLHILAKRNLHLVIKERTTNETQ